MKARFRKNEIYTVRVEDITDLGFGVAHIDGAAVFVSDTVPGDLVKIRLIKVAASYLIARAREYIERGAEYSPRCPEPLCRSCAYRGISYESELSKKEEGVRRLFARLGIETAKITASPECLRYRNKAQYPITLTKDGYAVGFFSPKSHRVTPVSDCLLTPEVFTKICKTLSALFMRHALTVYDETSGEGLLRHVYLRRGEVSGEVLLTLVVTSYDLCGIEDIVTEIRESYPEVVGILLNKNERDTNIVLGEEYKLLWGRDYIYDTLAGVELKITAPSFYQVNRRAAELLYKKACELAVPEKSDTLLDLYCGAGSIGLSMAHLAGEVVGIEIVESAVLCARENAKKNGIENAVFYTGDATECERLLEVAEGELNRKIRPDVIILDPPRGGIDERLVRFTAELGAKRIVYISCNPKTLARDTERYAALGYTADTVYPFDLFPMTGHVESLVCLTKQTN